MLQANELRDKYKERQRGTDLESICKLMDANGVTIAELQDYIENHRPPSTLDQVKKHRKKAETSRRFTYGRSHVSAKSSKSTKA